MKKETGGVLLGDVIVKKIDTSLGWKKPVGPVIARIVLLTFLSLFLIGVGFLVAKLGVLKGISSLASSAVTVVKQELAGGSLKACLDKCDQREETCLREEKGHAACDPANLLCKSDCRDLFK